MLPTGLVACEPFQKPLKSGWPSDVRGVGAADAEASSPSRPSAWSSLGSCLPFADLWTAGALPGFPAARSAAHADGAVSAAHSSSVFNLVIVRGFTAIAHRPQAELLRWDR